MNPILWLENINFTYTNGNSKKEHGNGFALKNISLNVDEKDFISDRKSVV